MDGVITHSSMIGTLINPIDLILNGGKMGVTASLLLIAAGAVLIWAVTATVSGISLVTVGWILLIVGLAGLVLSLIFWSSWGGFSRETRDTTVIK